ncbi:aminotransferase class V-fold PLP-dependent enzyme [Neobacillus mesonae]|uniref:aminotransferase class V-fold PLP-dependent enzyme n=1 Tax=Neobacillus mesonae TaxID=1193713 RepID=UPI0025743F83|nr:aminotransferase class V-fold PLP-dependent enzyme [Neobacillus mesonae]
MNLNSNRSLFPILSSHTHLASCSQGAIAIPVSKAIEDYHQSLLNDGTNWSAALKKADAARGLFAQLIGAEKDEVAILCSVSDTLSSIMSTLSDHPKRKGIVFTDINFPTVGHILYAQKRFKDHPSIVRSFNNEIPLEQYEKKVSNDTLLTCIPHVNYCNGYKQDVKKIADIVHGKGSLLFVDAYQSAGHIPINVKEMGIDMLATGTRKYLLGIPGVAFLYIRKELAEELNPRVTGWMGQEESATFDLFNLIPAVGTRRFETGTPAFISIYAAYEALRVLLEVGINNIESHLKNLTQFGLRYGLEKGLSLAGPLTIENRTSLMSFHVENAPLAEAKLRERKIIVSARKDVIRIAPHFYNTQDDIQLALDELSQLV